MPYEDKLVTVNKQNPVNRKVTYFKPNDYKYTENIKYFKYEDK